MVDAIKDQSSGPGNVARPKLRYPLRSTVTKAKNDNSGSATAQISNSSASKRGKPASNLSKSVSVLDHSVKDKSAKSTRRLSVPAKSAASPLPRSTGTITPISETRTKRSTNGQGGKSEAPVSDVSKPVNKRKFSILSSASYWLTQIKISESAAKHSISVGFFKLALESGCEPLQRMRDELKSYVRRHHLSKLGEPVKELLRSYNISEDLNQLQVSETCSLVPEEGTPSSGEVLSSSSTTSTSAKKLRPKPLNTESIQASSVAESAKKEDARRNSTNRNRASVNRNSTKLKSGADKGAGNLQKKSQRPSKQELNKEKAKTKNEGKNSACEKGLVDSLPAEETQQEDKENMDAQQMEEISLTQ